MLHQVKILKGNAANESLVSWTLFVLGAGVITMALLAAILKTDVSAREAVHMSDETAALYMDLFGEELR